MVRGALLCAIALAFGAACAQAADTIVLKNGKRIVALSVREEGDKITYETAAGELSLPKSIVDHIDKGNGVAASTQAGAADLGIAPPATEAPRGAAEIESETIRNGAIDRNFVVSLEVAARSGGQEARLKAAVAHHLAAQFEQAHGDIEHALDDERIALSYAGDEPAILLNLAYMHLKRSEYKQSLDYVERAKRVAPQNPDVAKLEGWAYYGMNKLELAVAAWKRALALQPDAEVQSALDKALRDEKEEESYKENESSHFNLRYSGEAEPALAREVLRTLEAHFSAVESELNFTPPDSIGVVLYTRQAFADITRAPAWAGGINDGRIRVPVQGLSDMTPDLSRVLKHELTHSFVTQKTRGRAPTWLQEGIAQWMEGKRASESAAELLRNYQRGQVALAELEGSWSGFASDAAAYAYAWSLATIEYIVETGGIGDVERILDRIGIGNSAEEAVREVLHQSYDDLTQATAKYLAR
jgi:tetratricopeptide (TPR) repeat protein